MTVQRKIGHFLSRLSRGFDSVSRQDRLHVVKSFNTFSPSCISDSKQPSHGLGNVLSQIVLGKSIKPDFNAEEKLSIEKDSREINDIVSEMADYLPKEDPDKGKALV